MKISEEIKQKIRHIAMEALIYVSLAATFSAGIIAIPYLIFKSAPVEKRTWFRDGMKRAGELQIQVDVDSVSVKIVALPEGICVSYTEKKDAISIFAPITQWLWKTDGIVTINGAAHSVPDLDDSTRARIEYMFDKTMRKGSKILEEKIKPWKIQSKNEDGTLSRGNAFAWRRLPANMGTHAKVVEKPGFRLQKIC